MTINAVFQDLDKLPPETFSTNSCIYIVPMMESLYEVQDLLHCIFYQNPNSGIIILSLRKQELLNQNSDDISTFAEVCLFHVVLLEYSIGTCRRLFSTLSVCVRTSRSSGFSAFYDIFCTFPAQCFFVFIETLPLLT